MNRAHNNQDALNALRLIAEAGFNNMTADLIYGVPGVSDDQWISDILALTDRKIPHISAYCLTVEDKTALAHFVKKGTSPPVQEEQANRQFDLLIQLLTEKGYQHYEISNFALPGMEANHNSSYWLGRHYMGLGPSAHSYNGSSRYWNVANNKKYTEALNAGILPPKEVEILSETQKFNEYILTRLRTHWGVNPNDMSEPFKSTFLEEVKEFIPDMIFESDSTYFLTTQGKMWADHISSQLFASED
jgi:oxygen-independent coproporphyrinogen-3 oxidase